MARPPIPFHVRPNPASFLLLVALAALSAPLVSAQQPAAPTIVKNIGRYGYAGCYNETTDIADSNGDRTLDGAHEIQPGNMTVDACVSFCSTGGNAYAFAGLEYSRECWCGTNISAIATKYPDSDCNLSCDGNKTEVCGGPLLLTIYELAAPRSVDVASGAVVVAVVVAVALNLF